MKEEEEERTNVSFKASRLRDINKKRKQVRMNKLQKKRRREMELEYGK